MKKGISVWQLWAVAIWAVSVYKNWPMWYVLIPFAIGAIVEVLGFFILKDGIVDKIRFWLFKTFVNRKIQAAGKKARKEYNSNPGNYVSKDINPKGF